MSKKLIKKLSNGLTKKKIVHVIFFITLSYLVTMAFIFLLDYYKFTYHLEVGDVSPKTFVAKHDAVDEAKTEENKQKAYEESQNIKPLLIKDETVDEKVIQDLNSFFELIESMRYDISQLQTPEGIEAYIADVRLPVALNDEQLKYLLTMSAEEYSSMKSAIFEVTNAILEVGFDEKNAQLFTTIKDELMSYDMTEEAEAIANQIISFYIQPNYVVDEEATAEKQREIANSYETAYIKKGQNIVDEGEIITEYQYNLLSYYGYINTENGINYLSLISVGALILIIFMTMLTTIRRYFSHLFPNVKTCALLSTLYIFILVACAIIYALFDSTLLLPICLFSMLVAILFQPRFALLLHVSFCMIMALMFKFDFYTTFFYIFSGVCLISLLERYELQRSKTLLISVLYSLINCLILILIALTNNSTVVLIDLVKPLISVFITSYFVIIFARGTQSIWESTFDVLTTTKLLELLSPTNKLLNRLTIEAPGTYHHSLIVANLADEAAKAIGANQILTRVGAYYHDIGKLKNVEYFAENNAGRSLHDLLSPKESAKIIKAHVDDGLDLAIENKLPKDVIKFIYMHHGNSLIKYFYHQEKERVKETGENIDINDFRYEHSNPDSKEIAIIMLADTVEAAIRSKIHKIKSNDEIKILVDQLIKEKIDERLLSNCELTFNDIEKISDAFHNVFKNMYHSRVEYPDDKKEIENKQETELIQKLENKED